MTKIKKSKYKISRRIGASLWGSDKDPVHKRNYRPGQHGRGLVRKVSDFKKQCTAQHTLRGYYAMQERQFRRFFEIAYRSVGNTSDILVGMLESRLSSVIYNAGFVATIFAANQLVSHKHVTVDGKVVNIRSFLVSPNQVVRVTERAAQFAFVKESIARGNSTPDYLEVDVERLSVRVVRVPAFADVAYPVMMQPHLVAELYSK